MDATIQTALRLHEQGIPRRTIAKRAGISLQKVRKILITAGAWSDETSEKIGKLRANGMSVPEFESEIRSEKQKKKPSPARIPHRMRAVALAYRHMWCFRLELNQLHAVLQTTALPTELQKHMVTCVGVEPTTFSLRN